jgi:pimeloyl-ACP methyl ester carboxylesterase
MLKFTERGAGPPVVLIHGFPLSRKMWRPQIAVLVEAGYKVICPDLPGFGESPAEDGQATMSGYADAVVSLLDQLGIEKAVVGGMSMGGYVLLDLLERYSARLPGAIFLVTRAAADDAAGKEKRSLLAAEVNAGNLTIVPETFSKVLFAPETPEKRPQLVAEVRQWMDATSVAGVVGGLLAMRDRVDYVTRLAGFNLPVLVVGASQDLAIPAEHSRLLAERLPDATLRIIRGAGHMVNLEKPEMLNQAVLEFLERLKGP